MNASSLITRCVVPSRHGVFNSNPTCPAAFTWMRSSDNAGQRCTDDDVAWLRRRFAAMNAAGKRDDERAGTLHATRG